MINGTFMAWFPAMVTDWTGSPGQPLIILSIWYYGTSRSRCQDNSTSLPMHHWPSGPSSQYHLICHSLLPKPRGQLREHTWRETIEKKMTMKKKKCLHSLSNQVKNSFTELASSFPHDLKYRTVLPNTILINPCKLLINRERGLENLKRNRDLTVLTVLLYLLIFQWHRECNEYLQYCLISGELSLKELAILGSRYGKGEISFKQGEAVTWSRPKQDVKNILQQL